MQLGSDYKCLLVYNLGVKTFGGVKYVFIFKKEEEIS